MSTTLDGRKAKKNYAEFDEYISYQLQKTQTGIRSTDIFTALCGAAVFVLSYLLIFVVFDHWVIAGGFGPGMRVALLSGLLVGTLAWLSWKVLWPCFRRVNSLYAARTLETASPELKSTLLNYVDLRSANREVAPAILGSMEKRAAVTLSHTEVEDAIDRTTLLRLSYALLVAVVLFSVYAVASPKKVWPSIVRIFAPAAEVSVSTQTAFLSVDPGDTKVLAREFLTVSTDLSGEVPEDVTLFYTTNDQQFVDEPVSMHEVEAGLKRYRCILKGNGGEGLLQGLSYRIVAGDASTRNYTVTVAQPPSASVKALRYTYPDYMELPPEHLPGSNIDTWEGTQIEVQATVNMPVEMAWMQFSDEAEFPARCEELRMKVADGGTRLTGLWQPIIREDGTHPNFYRIQCKTADGATDPTPAVHTIQINADQKPEVSTLQPNTDTEVAVNAIVPLLIQTSDPDFRLSQVLLRMKNGTRSLTDRTLYKGNDIQKRILYDLKIAELNAKPGDVITWWIEAHDNRRVETPIRTLLDANRSTSPRLKFIIKAPMPEKDVNEQLEHDKQRAQEKLEELDQQAGDASESPDQSEAATPDQQADNENDSPSNTRDPNQKQDDARPEEEPPADDRNSDSDNDENGAGGSSDSDSESDSNDDSGKGSSDKTGKSEGEKSEAGKGESSDDGTGSESTSGDQKTDSGPKKPVSNDGSQDDQILRELLKRNRDSKKDTGKDNDKGDDDQKGDSTSDDQNSNKGDSPQNKGDAPSEEPSKGEPGQPDANSEKSDTDTPQSDASEDSEKPQTEGTGGNKTDDQNADTPGEPKQDGDQEKSSDSGKSPSADQGNKPNSNPSNDTGTSDQNSDGTGEQPANDPAAKPDSDMPKSDSGTGSDDKGDATSGQQPSGKEPGTSQSQDGGANQGSDGTTSKPGSGNQPGKPGDGSSGSKSGSGPKPSSPDGGASSNQPPTDKTGKGGTGSDPDNKSPGSEGSKPSSDNGNKADGASPSGKPGQSPSGKPDGNKPGTSQPGDPKGDSESGSKPESTDDQGKPDSGSGSDQKPGDPSNPNSSQPSDQNPSGKPNGKPGSGQPSGQGKGQPGSGQDAPPGAKSGQGGTGDAPRVGSDASDNPVKRPDDNADPNQAVQKDKSGANVHDPNLPDADKANLEDKLKASNMVLKRLKEELDRGEVDPELLRKLGWTEKDMERFAERLERQLAQPKPDDPSAEARRRQFEEVLRSVDLESSGRQQEGNFTDQKSTSNFTGRRLKAPREHRKAYEEYIKRLSRQRRGTSKPGPSK